jgi:hypothetical protein
LNVKANRLLRLARAMAALTLVSLAPSPVRADFFDDARRTFENDIPHFFQDDIPCAFGGQPTSHTKTSCKSTNPPPKSTGHAAKHATDKDVPSDKAKGDGDTPPSSDR